MMKDYIKTKRIFNLFYVFIFILMFISNHAEADNASNNELIKSYEEGKKSALYWSIFWDLKEWGIAFEKHKRAHGEYPTSNSIEELRTILAPYHVGEFSLKTLDPWQEKYLVKSTKDKYIISSKGEDKTGSHEFGGIIEQPNYNQSVTLQNGKFVQYRSIRSKTVQEFEIEINNIK